ncbi:MAG: chemotaxis protein CheB [Isosphaeraceae bacterium]|nr:chemotaxis protein CheB [Isosphaeraceae bacterium]
MTSPLYLVGIGASAGGLEALELFFESVPEDTGMAFVVIQHLSPDFKSLMDELLSRRTRLTIRRAEEGMIVEPNSIYLIPPKKELTLSGMRLCLIDRDPYKTLSFPIDTFFRSLARDMGNKSVAIVLSGTGSDGSRGIRDIHAAGGLVLAQSVETAKFDGMPRSAIETGLVDYSLPPDEMPEILVRYVNRPEGTHLSQLLDDSILAKTEIGAVFDLLNREFGIDFAHYKPGTVARRVERRIELTSSKSLKEYASLLKSEPEELNRLYCDLLIGVTRFFRDEEAYEYLENKVLPTLFDRVPTDEELRVWVAGCATGEEAYSIAMVVHEQLLRRGRPLKYKIFATDVHPESLEEAGQGIYDHTSLAGVSTERLERFFVPKGTRYQVVPEIRSRIVFSRQNVIRDAPFTRIDLISCRNLLIYLQPFAQRKAISLFHFGLKIGGVLFLGPSESAGEYAEEFEPIESHWKIFRKRRGVRLRPESTTPFNNESLSSRAYPAARPTGRSPSINLSLVGVYDALLAQHMPPAILINERREVVHCFGGAGVYLSAGDGRFSLDLLDMLDPGLRVIVGTALSRVAKGEDAVSYSGFPFELNRGRTMLDLTVKMVHEQKYNMLYYLILIAPAGAAVPGIEPPVPSVAALDLPAVTNARIRELELELQSTRENLQRTIEEGETGNEELQATNEELIASNEELQSTNEELHSVNEELYTVNAEHQKKIDQLTELTNDLDNLFVSFDIGLIFLDRDLRIRKFTPRIADQFALIPIDIGRRIDGFAHTLVDLPLVATLRAVIETGTPYEGEVRDIRGDAFLLRVHPYLSGGQTSGAVMSLIDIAALKRVEHELMISERRHKTLSEGFSSVVWTTDATGRFVVDHPRWSQWTGQSDEQARGYGWIDALHPDDREGMRETWRLCLRTNVEFDHFARVWSRSHAEFRETEIRGVPVIGEDGKVVEWVGQAVDVHERKRNERELRVILDNVQVAVVLEDRQGRLLHVNPYFASLFGAIPDSLEGRTVGELLSPEVAREQAEALRRVTQTGASLVQEEEWLLEGRSLSVIAARHPVVNLGGEVNAIVTVFTDITSLKRVQEERNRYALHLEESNKLLLENMILRENAAKEASEAVSRRDEFLAMLSHELRNPLNAIVHASSLFGRVDVTRDRLEQAHDIVRRQSLQLGRLLYDLLDVTRLDRGAIAIDTRPMDLAQTVEEATGVIRPFAEKAGLKLELETVARPIWIQGDHSRLQQVFVNLLNNAVAFTPPGGKIRVVEHRDDDQIRVDVIDTGKGIEPSDLDRIFDLFFRTSDAPNRTDSSMGVGLTLVKRIVELHGGEVVAESEGAGKGAVFSVRLTAIEPPSIEPTRSRGVPVSPRRGLSVVIVEDNKDTLQMLSYILELEGYRVIGASDGESGLQAILRNHPDVAIVDIGLPLMDGCEVARQVRNDPSMSNVLLIALTGYGQAHDGVLIRNVGFDDHLIKPISPTDVSSYIASRFPQN